MSEEGIDPGFEAPRQKVVFQHNAVRQGLMPPLHCPAGCSDAISPRMHARHSLLGGGRRVPEGDVAAEIVEDRAEREPAPAQNLEVGEVRLPQLVIIQRS